MTEPDQARSNQTLLLYLLTMEKGRDDRVLVEVQHCSEGCADSRIFLLSRASPKISQSHRVSEKKGGCITKGSSALRRKGEKPRRNDKEHKKYIPVDS